MADSAFTTRRVVVAPSLREVPAVKVTEQSSEGLRRALFDAMDSLRNGKTTPTVANATARLAEQIVNTVQLEMEVERQAHHLGKRGKMLTDVLPPVVPLGDRREAQHTEIRTATIEGDDADASHD